MTDILRAFRALPLVRQVWLACLLVPLNLGGFAFAPNPVGVWAGILGLAGLAPAFALLLRDRRFSRAMAAPRIAPFAASAGLMFWVMTGPTAPVGALAIFAWALAITNAISVVFDIRDTVLWSLGGPGRRSLNI